MHSGPALSNHRGKLLVVDDSPSILASLCELLHEDHEVIFASSGEEALELAYTSNPDLILLDVVMPGIDGFEVCASLKSSPGTRDIPVIFITSMGEEVDQAKGLEAGAIDYVQKPFSSAVVKARVRNHLEVKRRQDALKGLTLRDGLTGIANRRRFDEALNEEWSRAARSRTPLSLIMIDVDHFKLYNDNYGHASGDACLRNIAAALVDSLLRPVDLLARFGGEEFVCLLPSTDETGALQVAERFKAGVAALAIPHEHSKTRPVVSISLGVATLIPIAEARPEILVVEADNRLYDAKRRGRNLIVGSAPGPSTPAQNENAVQDPAAADLPAILLVDDDLHMRAILSASLATLRARVEVVPDAREALNFLSRSRPSLILSDVVMPGMDGFSLCQQVKANPTWKDIPFVLLTSLSRNLRERSVTAGADDYLSKMEDDQVFRMRTSYLLDLGTAALDGVANGKAPGDRTVYLASASSTIRTQMEMQLHPVGIRLHGVPGLQELWTDLGRRKPDLIAIDLDTEGGILCEWLPAMKKLPGCERIPVVVLAAKGEDALLRPLQGWIDDRLQKPLEAQDTRHRVNLLLQLGRIRKPG